MGIYAHPHHPEQYPQYLRRPIKAVTWETLHNRVQFTSMRSPAADDEKKLRSISEMTALYSKTFRLGNVFWMFSDLVFAENLEAFLQTVKDLDGYLFDIWGYVPGSYKEGLKWGEYPVSSDVHKLICETLGDHFMGYDNGEQDGRYIGGYTPSQSPAYLSDAKQHMYFYRHFDMLCNHFYHYTTALCSLNFCHYFARENNCCLLGAETAQALPNGNIWYAFLRGAGKQYGLLWFGNASVYNRFGWKSYNCESDEPDEEGFRYGPAQGSSLSLMRRLMYTEYFYNCAILGFEAQLLTTKENCRRYMNREPLPKQPTEESRIPPEEYVLSPLGELQRDCHQFTNSYGLPGVMHTPICIVIHQQSGWVMPRHLYTSQVFRTWGQLPYSMGDYQLHEIFSMFYPGVEGRRYLLRQTNPSAGCAG